MKSTANTRTRWVLSLFAILTLSLAVISGCDDDETVIGVVLGPEVFWTTVSNSPTDRMLHDVQFLSTTTGWAVGDEGTILAYVDSAAYEGSDPSGNWIWVIVHSGTSMSLRGVHFTDPSHGWIIGRDGIFLYTTNAGSTWKIDSTVTVCEGGTSPVRKNLNGIHFTSAMSGWAVGEDGYILKWSTDSACANILIYNDTVINDSAKDTIIDSIVDSITYVIDSIDTTAYYPDSVVFDTILDSTIQWNVDSTIIEFIDTIITVDSTVPVTEADSYFLMSDSQDDPKQDLWDVHFADAANGWVVGKFGAIYRTTDGGATWEAQKSGTAETLRAVRFVSPSTGWVVGHHGLILHTKDGGISWTQQFDNNGISAHFVGVEFPDASNGWVVGTDGSVYRTADGGANWVVDLEGSNQGLNALSFIDATTGWVVGFDGEIMEAKKK